MSKKLLPNKLGKVFLMIGIVFAISGFENVQAQAVEVRCIREEYRGGGNHSHTHQYYRDCNDDDISCSEGWIDGGGRVVSSYVSPALVCVQWALFINGSHVSNLSQLKSYTQIQESDADFKTRVMRVLPLKELAEMYDPNKIYQ